MEITPELVDGLPMTGPTDPIAYYRRPIVGWLYRERINQGLRMLGNRRFKRGLEIGYGAGAVLMALAPSVEELHGMDLDADAEQVTGVLGSRGHKVHLRRANVYELPYETGMFDLAVSFSVFEHLHEFPKALSEVHRVLQPGGYFLLGMPAVNRLMELAFRAIGFKGIEDHHVTTPQQVNARFSQHGFSVISSARLGSRRVPGAALYYNWLLQRHPAQ